MQDRSSAIALVLVLAICSIGMYVAVSGFVNSTPQTRAAPTVMQGVSGTLVVLVVDTETPVPKRTDDTAPSAAVLATSTPLGPVQTVTASATVGAVITTGVTITPAFSPVPTRIVTPTPAGLNLPCGGLRFCPSGGPPDAQFAPNSIACPANYIWGRVTDANGIGIVGMKVSFRIPYAGTDRVETKGPPDPAGVYNIVTGPSSGPWTLWLIDGGGGRASPDVTVQAPQNYTGSGNCPTRVDFRAQR